MQARLIALIIQIATLYGIPPYLMVAIAEVESNWVVDAIRYNKNGTVDRGLMQLNSSWYNSVDWADPEYNVNAAAQHIAWLRSLNLNWYQVVVAYNCGVNGLRNPPATSIDYAVKVFDVWESYDRMFVKYVGQ